MPGLATVLARRTERFPIHAHLNHPHLNHPLALIAWCLDRVAFN